MAKETSKESLARHRSPVRLQDILAHYKTREEVRAEKKADRVLAEEGEKLFLQRNGHPL